MNQGDMYSKSKSKGIRKTQKGASLKPGSKIFLQIDQKTSFVDGFDEEKEGELAEDYKNDDQLAKATADSITVDVFDLANE